MPAKISRRALANNTSALLAKNESFESVLNKLAAYLIDTKRTNEADLIVRDIEDSLTRHHIVIARVTSARRLSQDALSEVRSYIKSQYPDSQEISIREYIDQDLIGGIKLELPGKTFDTSVKAKLEKLRV